VHCHLILREILDGQYDYDNAPVYAFYFSGDLAEIRANVGRVLIFGPLTMQKPA
jgi:hypothetical protein